MFWGLAALSLVVAFAAVRILLGRFGSFALDEPNERSLHAHPVPRTGGIAILAGSALAAPIVGGELWLPMLLALLLAVLSFYDDVRGLRTRTRLLAHFTAAALLVWYVMSPMNLVAMLVLVLAVVWVTNLYNFMDGADGVAGGMAIIGFGAYAAGAWLAGHYALAALCMAIAAASAAFLAHNFHPARIFLGDVGSIPLGFLAAALGIVGWRDDVWPLWFPLLVFGPFNADATITLVKRLLRREKVWQPHRDHYYQRIVRMGLGHRAAALIGYVVMAICAAAALLGRGQSPTLQALAFGAGTAVLAAMALWVDRRWARFAKSASA
jgi:UDP-N-acetylmuramyl pentapeptide phosphotransferase/UDP-N-acetylglucosamine-1-phosphate transferase